MRRESTLTNRALLGFLLLAGAAAARAQSPVSVTLLQSTSPAAAEPGVTSISVTGSNFPSGVIPAANVTVSLARSGGGSPVNAVASAIATVAGTTRRVTFIVPASVSVQAPTGYTVSLSGTTSTGVAFASANSSTLTVNPAATISITPATGQPGQTLSVAVTGVFSNFLQGPTIAAFGAGITVNSVTVANATHATVAISIAPTAVNGSRNVAVTTGLEIATLPNGFSVSGTPALLSATPNNGQQGQQNLSVAIAGQFTHFVQGTSAASFGAGITVASLAVASPTSATALLKIDPTAATGSRTLTVTTGTEAVTLVNAFTVNAPAPVISVTPNPLSFGSVPITTSSTKTVTIANPGLSPLTVNSVTLAGAYFTLGNLPAFPLVINAAGTATFPVTFAPLGTIASTATVSVASNATSAPTAVAVTGTGAAAPQPPAAAITLLTDQRVYRRAQPVRISGTVTAAGGAGISNVPVTLKITVNGATRTFNPFTDAQGGYQQTFQPGATEGGAYSVTAIAGSGGATQTATTTFRILGLFVSPLSLSQDVLAGGTAAVPLDLQNVGDAALTLTYAATVTPANAVNVTFPQALASLAAGTPVTTIPVVLTAPGGTPPSAPVTVQVTITATDAPSSTADPETSTFSVTIRPPVTTLSLTPPSLNVGVNPGGTLTRTFAVTNLGYAPSNNSTVTLQDPSTYRWVSLGNASLGNIAAGATSLFQVVMNPPASLPLGTYPVAFNISGGGSPLSGTVNINVTQSTLGAVSFTVSDDTGAKVGGATVTLIGTTNKKNFQGVTTPDGTATLTGVDAGAYTWVVSAPLHDPGSGTVNVTANSTTQVSLILVYNVVNLTFTVTPTTITDQYNVTLNVLYSTKLPKPALRVTPIQLLYSFFPSDYPNGRAPCSLNITNTHPTANVFNASVDASLIDAALPNGLRIHIQFEDGTTVYQIGSLAGKASTTVPCYATLDGDNVPTHKAGDILVKGNYYYSLDGNILIGTTTTKVPVTYTRPSELEFEPIPFTYDQTDPANPVLKYDGAGFVYTLRGERPGRVLTFLKPSGALFAGHTLSAFVQTQDGLSNLDVINANQSGGFWHTDLAANKPSLLDKGDTATYDISTLDAGQTLYQAIQAQITANPAQALNRPMYLALEGQWSDRGSPTGYLIPIQITNIGGDGDGTVTLPFPDFSKLPGSGLSCLNPEDPLCALPDDTLPVTLGNGTGNDGQILIAIDQKIRLERQAFNARLGIGAQAPLTAVTATIKVRDASGRDASSNFFVLLTSDTQGATKGGSVTGNANVAWQLIPNAGVGGTQPQGVQYTVQATLNYTVAGISKTATTQSVTITVLPSPKLNVSYSAPFVVMAGKDAKIRVTIQNVGYGAANNFSIQSAQPRIVSTTNPNLFVGFNITGSSNTADSSGLQPGNLTMDFGNVAPGATVSGYWTLRVSQNGFFIDISSTFSQQDYQGIQLDPLVNPPTTTLIPALGGTVKSDTGQAISNMTVALALNGATSGSDVTDSNGVYYISDLTAGPAGTYYSGTVTDSFGKGWLSRQVGILGDQGTSLLNFVIAGINAQPVTITSIPSGQPFTFGGVNYTTPQTLQGFTGSTYAVNFGSGISQGTGARYALSGWTDGSTANPRTITVGTSPASYNANFGTQYLLSLTSTPPGAGSIAATPPNPDGYYNANTVVQLAPALVAGHRFLGFTGALTGTATPQSLTLTAPVSVAASFTAPVAIISTHVLPGGVPVNTPSTVQISARISDVNTVIAGSVNLVSTDANGNPLQVLGQLQPVSTQRDGSYGDFSISIPINQSTPQTLYYEVSAAARGSLRRVHSAPIPLLAYTIPSDSEISQTVTAYSGAVTQFAQARTTLGDAVAIAQAAQALQQQVAVASVHLSADGLSLRAVFRDGTAGIITADQPIADPFSSADKVSDRSLSAKQSSDLPALFPRASGTIALTGGTDVLVLAPQHALWSPNQDPSDTVFNDFNTDLATGRIHSLTYLKDTSVSVAAMKNMSQYSVISIASHGDYDDSVGSYILTGEPVTPAGDRQYALDLRLGLIVRAYNPDAGGIPLFANGAAYYAITRAFVEYYHGDGYPNSIVYLDACRSVYDTALANAFLVEGASRVFGHTGLVRKTFGATAGVLLFSVLSNGALPSDRRSTAQAFAAVTPNFDIFSSLLSLGHQESALPMNSLLTVSKSGNGTGSVTSTSGLSCPTACKTATAIIPPTDAVTLLTAVADPGMSFNGWGGDCAISTDGTSNATARIDSRQDWTCTATFVVAAKISLSPSGTVSFASLDIARTGGPYYVQVVSLDGITQISAPLDITVNLTKQVTSACNIFLRNVTVTIPAGSKTGALDFVAGSDYCGGSYVATTTKWIINSVFMGPSNIRLATVAGQTILSVVRGNSPVPLSMHLTWKGTIIDPSDVYIRQGDRTYPNSFLAATVNEPGGSFTWTPTSNALMSVTTSGDHVSIVGLKAGSSHLDVSYRSPSGQSINASVVVHIFYPLILIHGFNSDPVGAWTALSNKLTGKGLNPGDYNCHADQLSSSETNIDFCAVDFCDNLSLITHQAVQPNGSCPYPGTTLPVWGSYSSPADEALALEKLVRDLLNETGAEKVVILAHSMGGLAARAYIQTTGASFVDRLITIGTPHAGTILADAVSDPNVVQDPDLLNIAQQFVIQPTSPAVQAMREEGAFIASLTRGATNLPASTKYVSIIGRTDASALFTLQGLYAALRNYACDFAAYESDPAKKERLRAACLVLRDQFGDRVAGLFSSADGVWALSDGIVSTQSQNMAYAAPGIAPQACLTFADSAKHSSALALGENSETTFTELFMAELGFGGTAQCFR